MCSTLSFIASQRIFTVSTQTIQPRQIAGIIIAQIESYADLGAENGAIFAVQANHLPVLRNLLGGFVLRQQKQGNILTIAVRQDQITRG